MEPMRTQRLARPKGGSVSGAWTSAAAAAVMAGEAVDGARLTLALAVAVRSLPAVAPGRPPLTPGLLQGVAVTSTIEAFLWESQYTGF